ncbi:phosphotransferase family protein [Bacillus inaquosorum]|uniref:phosphotransferase family protein n=1 Tax=Bacillus inaquosorum TaxID=483913 RepID=UPI003CFC7794
MVWSHNDLHKSNILVSGNSAFLIDFDQSGANSKYFDLATLSLSLELSEYQEHTLLNMYSNCYNYEKFTKQKVIVAAQYALSVITLINDMDLVTVNKHNSSIPFLWEGEFSSNIDNDRFNLAYNFLNYFNLLIKKENVLRI